MTNDVAKQILDEIKSLRREVALLLPVITQDAEGEYRPDFVKKMIRAKHEKASHIFTTPEAFLKHIRK